MVLFKAVTISLILLPLILNLFPDIDLRVKIHRFFVFHSIFIPLFVLIFNYSLLTVLIALGVGLHCLCDITIFKSKMKGTYTIVFIPSVTLNFLLFKIKSKELRLNGVLSTVWLVSNFIISLIIFIVYVVIIS